MAEPIVGRFSHPSRFDFVSTRLVVTEGRYHVARNAEGLRRGSHRRWGALSLSPRVSEVGQRNQKGDRHINVLPWWVCAVIQPGSCVQYHVLYFCSTAVDEENVDVTHNLGYTKQAPAQGWH